MRYERIIEEIRQRAGLGSDADAETVLVGTLAVLGERVGAEAGLKVGSQLPEQLATYLRRESAERASADASFDADGFVDRVGAMTGLANVEEAVVATLGVIGEATGGALDGVRGDLPSDYERLFQEVPGSPGG